MEPELYDRLDGQVALVTGANRGIGKQIAENLTELGVIVYAGVRSMDHDVGDRQEKVLLDVTQHGEVQNTVENIGDEANGIDILVNNAGVGEFGDDLIDEPVSAMDRTLMTNVRGPMLTAKHALPYLLQHEGGRIVNVSSGMGALGEEQSGGAPSYRISKTGINGLTAYLHGEYADDGLVANSVCPGWVRTDMGGEEADRPVEKGAETPTWLCRFKPGSPAGKFWRDKEVIDW